MTLEVKNAACGYGTKMVVQGISIGITSGDILCLLGPNGVGKTTFFKTLLGFLKLRGGEIQLNGRDINTFSQKERARSIGYVPQAHTPPFPFTVLQVALMGRTAHLGSFSSPSGKDVELAEETLHILGISFLRDRIYTEISGGERQMVLIARALVQQPEILVMDEPTSNLDFGNQIRVLGRIRQLADSGLGIVMTSHFPDHAFLCATKVALIRRDGLFQYGTADEVVTEENLRSAYGVNVRIASIQNGKTGVLKACIPVMTAQSEIPVPVYGSKAGHRP